jgi:Pyridoxamine 5'-phosphate oxidase
MYQIDDSLREFVESGVGAIVATGDSRRRPHVKFGWSPRVHEDGQTVDVFLDAARASQTLANLRDNGRIAMTIVHPVSVRSVQFKGTFRGEGSPSADDVKWVQRGREGFSVSMALVGDPPEVIRNLWLPDVLRISFVVEQAFDQTPGPEAGKPL